MAQINFNSNEFTPLSNEVEDTMKDAIDLFANASPISYGNDNKIIAEVTESKYNIIETLNAEFYDIFYSYGGLQAEIDIINWAILLSDVKLVISSAFEDKAKLDYLKHLVCTEKIELHLIKTSDFGELDLEDLQEVLKNKPSCSLISLSHANRFTGVLLPVKDVVVLARQNNAFFHLNTSLTIGKYKIDLDKIKPDFLTFDSGLINGPIGVGCILINEALAIDNKKYHQLLVHLKSVENKNVALITGLRTALAIALTRIKKYQKETSRLKAYFINELEIKLGIKTISFSLKKNGLFNQLAFFISEKEYGKYLIEKLDLNGYLISIKNYPLQLKNFAEHHFINISLSERNISQEIDLFINHMIRFRK